MFICVHLFSVDFYRAVKHRNVLYTISLNIHEFGLLQMILVSGDCVYTYEIAILFLPFNISLFNCLNKSYIHVIAHSKNVR